MRRYIVVLAVMVVSLVGATSAFSDPTQFTLTRTSQHDATLSVTGTTLTSGSSGCEFYLPNGNQTTQDPCIGSTVLAGYCDASACPETGTTVYGVISYANEKAPATSGGGYISAPSWYTGTGGQTCAYCSGSGSAYRCDNGFLAHYAGCIYKGDEDLTVAFQYVSTWVDVLGGAWAGLAAFFADNMVLVVGVFVGICGLLWLLSIILRSLGARRRRSLA